jgi:hypothetical protein
MVVMVMVVVVGRRVMTVWSSFVYVFVLFGCNVYATRYC